jgi:hypothetical protein
LTDTLGKFAVHYDISSLGAVTGPDLHVGASPARTP